ncbi:MAG: hypothetical protein WDZ88_03810 [Candidatus Paceibacterota bacterium]
MSFYSSDSALDAAQDVGEDAVEAVTRSLESGVDGAKEIIEEVKK